MDNKKLNRVVINQRKRKKKANNLSRVNQGEEGGDKKENEGGEGEGE
jgi:hypothetical protein